MTKTRIIFFGTAEFSLPSLRALIENKFNVVAVVTKQDFLTGRGRVLTAPAIKTFAAERNIPVLQPSRLREIEADIKALKPDIGAVIAFGKILPQTTLDLFPNGLINAHASLLPKYRGPSPIEAALLAGDAQTGVSLMHINARMDEGDVFCQQAITIIPTDTRLSLYDHLSRLSAKLFVEHLPQILAGTLTAKPQDASQASIVRLITKSDGEINWSQPAETVERTIRAYLGWPGSHFTLGHLSITVTSAHIVPVSGTPGQLFTTSAGELGVYCSQDAIIIDRLKPAGKNEMTGKQYLAGHPIA